MADAIARNDLRNLEEELGDLLLQVVFHAQMASEQQAFNFEDVARGIAEKMIRRHPHVFPGGQLDGDTVALQSADVVANWDAIKKAEKAARGESSERVLDGVAAGLPALTRAEKLQKKASKVGFDWNDPRAVIAKLREELDEVEAELDAAEAGQDSRAAQEDELGDLLFCVVNLARHLKLDSEMALKRANAKFERRFAHIEDRLAAAGLPFAETSLEQMEALWVEAKHAERLDKD